MSGRLKIGERRSEIDDRRAEIEEVSHTIEQRHATGQCSLGTLHSATHGLTLETKTEINDNLQIGGWSACRRREMSERRWNWAKGTMIDTWFRETMIFREG